MNENGITFEQYAIKYMTDRGMWEKDAYKIFNIIKVSEESEPMKNRWNHKVSDYPPTVSWDLAISINQAVLKWIDSNVPLAWFRPMFG